jgi:hypothetical protein
MLSSAVFICSPPVLCTCTHTPASAISAHSRSYWYALACVHYLPQVQLLPSALGASRTALRQVLLVRSPAVLLDAPGSSSESYDDLLALDQFNVKRAVKPSVLAGLPTRGASEADRQLAAQCFICYEAWRPQPAAAAAPAGSECYAGRAVAAADVAGAAADLRDSGVGGAAGICRCRCGHAEQLHAGATVPHSTAARGAVVLNVVAVQHQQQQQLQQQLQQQPPQQQQPQQQQPQQLRLGCFGGWGAGMFRQASASMDNSVTAGAVAAAAAAAASPGAAAHVEVVYNSRSSSSTASSRSSCSCKCGSRAMQAAAVKPAPPVLILQLPCGHEFCVGCIGTWLAEHVTCPICRWSFPESQTQLINMHK